VADLGVPTRFLHMLRMFKVTSPMSLGSWLLTAFGPLTAAATISAWTGKAHGPGVVAKAGSAMLGLPLSTYTAALVANTAVPVWHEAPATLPAVFASGAAASAGAAAMGLTPPRDAAPARRLTAKGCTLLGGTLAAMPVARRRAGALGASALVTTGAVLARWSIFKAGSQSVADPSAVAVPQRRRVEQRAEWARATQIE
jgi:hypothetical protein